mgnify:FL=1
MKFWCLDCKKEVEEFSDEYHKCKDAEHDIDSEHMFTPSNEELGIPIKVSTSKHKAPNIERIVKGWFGDTFVESVFIDRVPHLLANVNGEIKYSERFEVDGEIIEPIRKQDSPYKPYEYTKSELDGLINNPPTKESLLERIKVQIDKYIDTTDNNKTIIQVDTFLTYCQDHVNTVHFLYIVGDTESGKSTIGHLLKELGYRIQYQTDLNYAGIYNFYGTKEEACGTIIEDEAQDLGESKEKIRLYKNSYTRGSKQAIVVGKDTANSKHQEYYATFGFKVFIGEQIPNDKGFRERLVILRMNTGFPESNIKRPTPEEERELESLRKDLLFYKVYNIREQLPQVKTGLTNRDEELFADVIRIASGTKFEEQARKVVKQYTKERQDSIHNSLESKIVQLVLDQTDGNYTIESESFWRYLTTEQDLIPGTLDKESFFSHDFGKITRQKISPLFTDKFQAQRDVIQREKKQITRYTFNPKILQKFVEKYNIELSIDHPLYQDRPTSGDEKDEL